jgi:L-fuconolactonase
MPTLDAQVHAYERNHPGRPWVGTLYGPAEVTGDQMVAAMDAVGVDGAVLVSPFSMYRYDASYALEVYAAHPDRFRLVKPVDPTDPAVVDTIADWGATQGTVGIRVFLRDEVSTDPPTPTSTVSWRPRRSIPCRSTWHVRGAWTRHDSWRPGIPIHDW